MLSYSSEKIVKEAKSKGFWIYDPMYKRWYSPEDFAHTFTYANANDKFLSQIQIRHPSEGIQAGFKLLSETQTKLNLFTKRVIDYYKK